MKLSSPFLGCILTSAIVHAISLQNSFLFNDPGLIDSTDDYFNAKYPLVSAALDDISSLESPKNLIQSIKPSSQNRKSDFEILTSRFNPKYSVRIKEHDPSKLNIDDVKQWSGYLDYSDKKHFFYWFFESRNDPKNDPVILWLNGGPGCSSFTGLFFELGPSRIGADLKPIRNPHSWNNNASVIFLEQPIGVGFSYGDDTVGSTAVAGEDVFHFLELFFTKFNYLSKNDFHIAGESYAGHYIPQIAHEIITRKEDEENDIEVPFNLTSILIGNGFTDPKVQDNYYAPMACGEGGIDPVLDPAACQKMNNSAKRCESLNNVCYLTQLSFPCVIAASYCERTLIGPIADSEYNIYDLKRKCDYENNPLCYEELEYIGQYMNQPDVISSLGSDVEKYEGCSNAVALRFLMTGDSQKPFYQYVAQLLDRAIPVLIYAGDQDYICNWLGNRAWTDQVGWRHTYKYRTLPLKSWKNDSGEEIGQVKSFGALTFLRLYGAGHMVPFDQPESSLYMVNNWISGNYKLGYELD